MGIYDKLPVQQNGIYPEEDIPIDWRTADTLTYFLWQIKNDRDWDEVINGFVLPVSKMHDYFESRAHFNKIPMYRYCAHPGHTPILCFYFPLLELELVVDTNYERPYTGERDTNIVMPFREIHFLHLNAERAFNFNVYNSTGLVIDYYPKKKLQKMQNGIEVPFRTELIMKGGLDKLSPYSKEIYIRKAYSRYLKAAYTISKNFVLSNVKKG